MLSIVDIKKELGENLYIYPIYPDSIKGNSIDFHASRFGWSLKTKQRLIDTEGRYLCIPPNDTALIYTEESIYISHHLGGTYHSKVTLVCAGLGHISTTLDPKYIGNCLVAVHNHSNDIYRLAVGSEFVTLILNYLSSSDYCDTTTNDNQPGHPSIVVGFNDFLEYKEWRDRNKWVVQERALYHKMTQSPEFTQCKENFATEQIKFNRKLLKNKIKKYGITFLITLAIFMIFVIPSYFLQLGAISTVLTQITERVILPLLLSIITGLVIVDLKK